MNTRRYYLIAGGILGVLVGIVVVAIILPLFIKSSECPVTPATQQDFDEAIAIGEDVFEPEIWELRSGEHPALISVGWFDHDTEAIAHSQYLLYNCGYSQTDVDQFYGEQNMDIMLGGYDSYQLTAICEQDGLSLREYDLVYVGRPFRMRFWVQPVNDKRVRDIHLAFAESDIDLLEKYAARLFPTFSSCSQLE